MAFIESEKVSIECATCVHGSAMIITGDKGGLHRLAFEIVYLMHNYSLDKHDERLTVMMIDGTKIGDVKTQDKLYIFRDGCYLEDIYSLVTQRINEGFKIEVETKDEMPWSREYVYKPTPIAEKPVDDGLGDLDAHPF